MYFDENFTLHVLLGSWCAKSYNAQVKDVKRLGFLYGSESYNLVTDSISSIAGRRFYSRFTCLGGSLCLDIDNIRLLREPNYLWSTVYWI